MSRVLDMWAGLTGTVLDFAGATAPNDWLMCYGQAISRTTYPNLFAAIGTTYGAGDGSTTFNLPDARGRSSIGRDNMGGTAASRVTTSGSGVNGAALGAVGGSETHTLTTAQMPTHTHANTLADPGHTHTAGPAGATVLGTGTSNGYTTGSYGLQTPSNATNTTGVTITNQSQGSGNAHPNVQPGIVFNKIIKV